MNNPDLFKRTKFSLDLDLFDYLAEQTEPQAIVNLADNLASALAVHLSKSPILLEHRALVKLFLNFELMAERLLLMSAPELLKNVASSKIACRNAIEECSNPFLFRMALEVSNLTICRKVRKYSEACSNPLVQKAFPPNAIIPEYLDEIKALNHYSSIEKSSSTRRILTYLRLGDILVDAVGPDYVAEVFRLWLSTFCNEIPTYPFYYQTLIYQEIAKRSSKFLLSYMETAFTDATLVQHFSKLSSNLDSSNILEELNSLPTMRLKYLFVKGTFSKLFKPLLSLTSVPSDNLRNILREVINFDVYKMEHCSIRRFIFSNDDKNRLQISLFMMKLSNEEKEQLKNMRETVRKEMTPVLSELLGTIQSPAYKSIYELLFVFSDDVDRSLLLTFENMKHLQADMLTMSEERQKDKHHVFPNYREMLTDKKKRETNVFDLVYIKKVALATYSKLLDYMKGMPNSDCVFPCFIVFINKGQPPISLFKNTLPEKLSLRNNVELQSRLLFVILGLAEYAVLTVIWEREKPSQVLSIHNCTNPVELLVHLEKFDHDSKEEQEDSWKLIQNMSENSDQRQHVLYTYMIILESRGINPDITLHKYMTECNVLQSNQQTPDTLLRYVIQTLIPMLKRQYNFPDKIHESNIRGLLEILNLEKKEETKSLMNFIHKLAREVAFLTFTPEGLCQLFGTLMFNKDECFHPIRKLPIGRRTFLMNSQLFSVEFKTFLIQDACLNIPREGVIVDQQLYSKSFSIANNTRLTYLPYVVSEDRKSLLNYSPDQIHLVPKVEKIIYTFLTTGERTDVDLPNLAKAQVINGISAMELGLIRGIANAEVLNFVSSTFAYYLGTKKFRRLMSPNLINIDQPTSSSASSKAEVEKEKQLPESLPVVMIKQLNSNEKTISNSLIPTETDIEVLLKDLKNATKMLQEQNLIIQKTPDTSKLSKSIAIPEKIQPSQNILEPQMNISTNTNATQPAEKGKIETSPKKESEPRNPRAARSPRPQKTKMNFRYQEKTKSTSSTQTPDKEDISSSKSSTTESDNATEYNKSSSPQLEAIKKCEKPEVTVTISTQEMKPQESVQTIETLVSSTAPINQIAEVDIAASKTGLNSSAYMKTLPRKRTSTVSGESVENSNRNAVKSEIKPYLKGNADKRTRSEYQIKRPPIQRQNSQVIKNASSQTSMLSSVPQNELKEKSDIRTTHQSKMTTHAQNNSPVKSHWVVKPAQASNNESLSSIGETPVLKRRSSDSCDDNTALSYLRKSCVGEKDSRKKLKIPAVSNSSNSSSSSSVIGNEPEITLQNPVAQWDSRSGKTRGEIFNTFFSPISNLLKSTFDIYIVDKPNKSLYFDLLDALSLATSVAIDFEMTGVVAKNGGSTVEGVKEHKVFQMGVCIVMHQDGEDYLSTWRINACEDGKLTERMFNKKSLEFLKQSLGKDFVKDMQQTLLDYSTLRDIFKAIQVQNFPVIVHNGYADLLHVSKILGEDITRITFDTFKPFFKTIYDTKYFCEVLNELYTGKRMTASLMWDTKLEALLLESYPSMPKSKESKMHDAAYDALATYLVYRKIINRFDELKVDYQTLPRKLFKMHFF